MKTKIKLNPSMDYMKLYQNWVEGMMQSTLQATNSFTNMEVGGEIKKRKVPCCPPDIECPPHCLTILHREAREGEVIVEAFAVKNCCGKSTTYRLGARPLKDQYGDQVSNNLQLDKPMLNLEMGQSIVVKAKLDTSGLKPGHRYTAEIVIREQDVNQNICFSVEIEADRDVPVVCPKDEAYYFNRFHSWESHYYCEKPRSRLTLTKEDNG